MIFKPFYFYWGNYTTTTNTIPFPCKRGAIKRQVAKRGAVVGIRPVTIIN